MINTARRTANVWIVITAIFVFGIFAPSIFGIDGFEGGFAMSTFSALMAITGVIVVTMYHARARAAAGILSGKNIMAHWTYTKGQWQDYSETDYRMDISGKWQLYRLTMAITAVVTIGFWIFNRDSGLIMLGVFLGLGVLLAGVVSFSTTYDHQQNMRYHGEVYIARDGVYIGRELHLWKGWGASLDDINYDETSRLLLIDYSIPARTGRNTTTIRIPVPPDQESKAMQITAELSGK